MTTEKIKLELLNLITVLFQNRGFDIGVIEEIDFIDDLGMDSITFISMVIEIEAHFGIEIPADYLLMERLKNVNQVINVIEEALLKTHLGES